MLIKFWPDIAIGEKLTMPMPTSNQDTHVIGQSVVQSQSKQHGCNTRTHFYLHNLKRVRLCMKEVLIQFTLRKKNSVQKLTTVYGSLGTTSK